MNSSIIRILIFWGLILIGCNNREQYDNTTLIITSIENSNSYLEKELSQIMEKNKEASCSDSAFQSYFKKGLLIDSISTRFYENIELFLNQNSHSKSEISEFKVIYKNVIDSLYAIYHSTVQDVSVYDPVDQIKPLNSNIADYRIMSLIYKNDVLLNQIEILKSIYSIHIGCNWRLGSWVICETIEDSPRKNSFRIKLVEEPNSYPNNLVELDSIYLNEQYYSIDLNQLIDNENQVSVTSLKKGKYILYGKLIASDFCLGRSKEFPFIHKFTID